MSMHGNVLPCMVEALLKLPMYWMDSSLMWAEGGRVCVCVGELEVRGGGPGGKGGGGSCNHLHNVLLLACTAAWEGALKAALGIIPVPRRKKVIDAHTMLIFNSGAENIGFLDEAELRRCKRILNAALHVASNLSRLQSSLTGKC